MDARDPRTVTQPRLIRLKDAPDFFGMDIKRFNREIRPLLTEIRIGCQGRAFDRLEMEALADDYKSRNGRPVAERIQLWDDTVDACQASSNEAVSGTSTKSFTERGLGCALHQLAELGEHRLCLIALAVGRNGGSILVANGRVRAISAEVRILALRHQREIGFPP